MQEETPSQANNHQTTIAKKENQGYYYQIVSASIFLSKNLLESSLYFKVQQVGGTNGRYTQEQETLIGQVIPFHYLFSSRGPQTSPLHHHQFLPLKLDRPKKIYDDFRRITLDMFIPFWGYVYKYQGGL